MNRTVVAVGVIVVAGIAVGASSLWRAESVGSPPSEMQSTPAPGGTAMPQGPSASPSTAATAESGAGVGVEQAADDENGVTGHASYAPPPTQLSTSPAPPERDSEPEAQSLAPALVAVRANLETLLKDAGPDGAAVVAALPGARAAIERLLNDSDPAVREQASALIKTLSPPPQ
jgi:hypothetical protein